MRSIFAFLSIFVIYGNLIADPLVIREIEPPAGYSVLTYGKNTFSGWIADLGLKKNKSIRIYDGTELAGGFFNVLAVVEKPLLFKQDLEQCADFCMRLWADYHMETNSLAGFFLFDYAGKKVAYAGSNKSYTAFLRQAFGYSNSYSLKQGCRRVQPSDLGPGDMFVQNRTGGIGHVSMVVSVCENQSKKRLYLLGYSFMPAQEFHIEKAADKFGLGGWFTLEGYRAYLKEYLDYGEPVLCRF